MLICDHAKICKNILCRHRVPHERTGETCLRGPCTLGFSGLTTSEGFEDEIQAECVPVLAFLPEDKRVEQILKQMVTDRYSADRVLAGEWCTGKVNDFLGTELSDKVIGLLDIGCEVRGGFLSDKTLDYSGYIFLFKMK